MHFIFRRFIQWVKALPGKPGHRKLWVPSSPKDYLRRIRGAQHYHKEIGPAPPVLIWSLYSGFTSFISIMVLCLITKYGAAIRDHNLPFAIAPAGASAVLIFAVPASPLAQPRNVIVGHVISALIGTFMNALFRHAAESFRWMPAALAVGISIFLMGLTNCYHPPAGATAFLGGFFASDFEAVRWWFPLYPVLPVALIMVAIGLIVNNICRVYPIYWFTPVHVPKAHSSPQPLPGEYADQANADNLDKELPAAAERGQISPSSVSMQPSPNDSSSSSVINPEGEVNDEAGNEMETQVAWLRARVHELEMELAHARHARQIYTFKTAHPDLA